jgi:hypothetical protein
MSARFANPSDDATGGNLVKLVRERQDLLAQLEQLDRRLVAAAWDPDKRTTEAEKDAWRRQIGDAESRLLGINRELPKDYVALTNPQPLALNEVQKLLREDEALVQFAFDKEEGYAWLVTSNNVAWRRIELGATG